jgi:hypothetical protein
VFFLITAGSGIPRFCGGARFFIHGSVDDWLAKSTSLEIANLSVKIQELKTASLATNASAYDKRIQETENRKAEVSLSNAEATPKDPTRA